ncbi:MAG: hypothetical protein HY958_05590 [Bacteroidia bacterium]|nr:hypothetical protein [Bacteroidia bacterium]
MFSILILFNIAFSVFFPLRHPVHVSMTNIEYVQNKKTFEITIKIFSGDFDEIVLKKYGVSMKLGQNDELKDCMKYINLYLGEHFSLEINKNKINNATFEFKEKKLNEDCIWLYFDLKSDQKIKQVKVVNSLLCDLFSDQTNLLIITCNGEQKGFNLHEKDDSATFEL